MTNFHPDERNLFLHFVIDTYTFVCFYEGEESYMPMATEIILFDYVVEIILFDYVAGGRWFSL